MLKWKAEGKIRWCGLTAHSEQVEWLKFVVASGLYDVAVVAFNYNSPKKIIRSVKGWQGLTRDYEHGGFVAELRQPVGLRGRI